MTVFDLDAPQGRVSAGDLGPRHASASPRAATSDAFSASGLLAAGAQHLAEAALRARSGERLPFAAGRWHAPAAAEEIAALDHVVGPALDLACGPGRLVRHLVDRGVVAIGVDAAPDAVDAALSRGAPALLGDLWGDLPDEGTWETVILFDGNIGIGAQPVALLDRAAALLAPGGGVLVEVGPPGTRSGAFEARIEWGPWRSAWFPWATVGVADIADLAAAAQLDVRWVQQRGGRCFVRLEPALEAAKGVAA